MQENYLIPRSFPAHGSCFHGYPITLIVNHESSKTEFEIQVWVLLYIQIISHPELILSHMYSQNIFILF